MDHGATSFPKAPGVAGAMMAYLEQNGLNINRGSYQQAAEAALTALETRELLLELFHCAGQPEQAVLTPGATFGLNQILKGYLRPGDHVVVSSLEHNAVMRPLSQLAETGVEFSRIPANRAGETDPKDLLPLLRPNTRLVLVSHASNVSGTIFPLEETAALCWARGLPLAVDAAQTAGHLDIDFSGLHLAALCVPGHKGLLGPQGIGALLLERDFAEKLTPVITGGTGSASDSEIQPRYLPDCFESGTLNLPGIYGLHAALKYIREQGICRLHRQVELRTEQFLGGMQGLPVRVAGPGDPKRQAGVISLDFPQRDNAEIAFELEQRYGILTRCGLHCAPYAHKTLGTFPRGTVRFSVGCSTTEQMVEDALAAIRALC